jgi:hypothetical protein
MISICKTKKQQNPETAPEEILEAKRIKFLPRKGCGEGILRNSKTAYAELKIGE